MKRAAIVGTLALVLILTGGCGGSHRSERCQLILRAIPTQGQRVTPAGMQTAQQIIRRRLHKLGVLSPSARGRGGDEVVIRFAGAQDPTEVAKIIGAPARLQMFDFEPSLAPPTVQGNRQPAPLPSLYALLKAVQKEANSGSPESYYLFEKTTPHPVLQGPAPSLQQLFLAYKDRQQPPHTVVLKVPARREPVSCKVANACPGAGSNGRSKSGEHWYLFKLPPALTGEDFVESGTNADVDPNSGAPIVALSFTSHGSNEFKRITRAEYNRGRLNAGRAGRLNAHGDQSVINRYAGHNAIVLDGELKQTPYIDYTDPTLSQGIIGNAQIFEPSSATARRTALVLQSGSLPYTFKEVGRSSCAR